MQHLILVLLRVEFSVFISTTMETLIISTTVQRMAQEELAEERAYQKETEREIIIPAALRGLSDDELLQYVQLLSMETTPAPTAMNNHAERTDIQMWWENEEIISEEELDLLEAVLLSTASPSVSTATTTTGGEQDPRLG